MATVKQKLAARKVLKGTPIKRAMREAGYASTTATTTGKLTRSKGWHELTDKYISEEALMKVHKEGLSATRIVNEEVEPDYAVRHKYLETGYKVRGRIRNDLPANNVTNVLNVFSEEQLKRVATRVFNGESTSEEPSDRLSNSNES
jgi:hypothetical protein